MFEYEEYQSQEVSAGVDRSDTGRKNENKSLPYPNRIGYEPYVSAAFRMAI